MFWKNSSIGPVKSGTCEMVLRQRISLLCVPNLLPLIESRPSTDIPNPSFISNKCLVAAAGHPSHMFVFRRPAWIAGLLRRASSTRVYYHSRLLPTLVVRTYHRRFGLARHCRVAAFLGHVVSAVAVYARRGEASERAPPLLSTTHASSG